MLYFHEYCKDGATLYFFLLVMNTVVKYMLTMCWPYYVVLLFSIPRWIFAMVCHARYTDKLKYEEIWFAMVCHARDNDKLKYDKYDLP